MTFVLALLLLPAVALSHDVPVLVNGTVFVLDARDAVDEGTLGASAGVAVANPGDAPAEVMFSLLRGDDVIDAARVPLAPKQTRVIRIDRLFAVSAPDGEIAFRSSAPVLTVAYTTGAQNETTLTRPALAPQRKRRAVRHPANPIVLVPRSVTLAPSRDNTLYETSDGSFSNGEGAYLFAGTTATRLNRRALLAFDLTSQIPPGSQITRVTLTLHITKSISGAQSMRLHRVFASWGEGASNAGVFRPGIGAFSRDGDATWLHTFFPAAMWSKAGGDFDATAGATAQSGSSTITWQSAAMTAHVQQWADQPATNFGWIVLGNEGQSATAKRFGSREHVPESLRPALTIEFNGRL
jgi:hypothetical protein